MIAEMDANGGATTLGGVSWINATNAQPLTFAPSGNVDRVEAYFRLRTNDAQGSVTIDSDPTVLATMNVAYGGAEMAGKAVATFLAHRARARLERPSTAFCSWITIGHPIVAAASRAGTDG